MLFCKDIFGLKKRKRECRGSGGIRRKLRGFCWWWFLSKEEARITVLNSRVPLSDGEAEGMACFPVMSLLWLSHSCSCVSSEEPCSLQITEIKLVLI